MMAIVSFPRTRCMRPLPVFLALSAACAASVAQQAPPPEPASPITDRFDLRVSAFYGTVKTRARIDDSNTGSPGTEISAEHDCHLSSRACHGRAEFMFR